eukprot:1180280-Prorocentrum_minimum.AAC.3
MSVARNRHCLGSTISSHPHAEFGRHLTGSLCLMAPQLTGAGRSKLSSYRPPNRRPRSEPFSTHGLTGAASETDPYEKAAALVDAAIHGPSPTSTADKVR